MQMEDRKLQAGYDMERDATQLEVWRREQAAAEAREVARQEARKRQMQEQAEHTRQQLAERAKMREMEKQAEYLEWKLQEKAEREYAAKVEALLRVRAWTHVACVVRCENVCI